MRAEKTAPNAAAIVVVPARHAAKARRVNVGKEIARARTNAATAAHQVHPRVATRAAIVLDRTVPARDGTSLALVGDAARVIAKDRKSVV